MRWTYEPTGPETSWTCYYWGAIGPKSAGSKPAMFLKTVTLCQSGRPVRHLNNLRLLRHRLVSSLHIKSRSYQFLVSTSCHVLSIWRDWLDSENQPQPLGVFRSNQGLLDFVSIAVTSRSRSQGRDDFGTKKAPPSPGIRSRDQTSLICHGISGTVAGAISISPFIFVFLPVSSWHIEGS